MCTVSWTFQPGGYDLFFSRDEHRRRAVARPPRREVTGGVAWLAPQDPQGGGTWILANAHGLTVCLLNAYTLPRPTVLTAPTASRRGLPLMLADAADLETCRHRLEEGIRSERYDTFFLLGFPPGGAPAWWIWNGTALHRVSDPVHPPVTTSSFDPERVRRARLDAFQSLVGEGEPSSEDLLRFHQCPDETARAATVRMSRPDARTVSLTRVTLANQTLQMAYAERAEDAGFSSWQTISLERLRPATLEPIVTKAFS